MVVLLVVLCSVLGVRAPARAAADVGDRVLYWNDVLLEAYRQVGGAPGPLSRAGAMVHLAMYDAANYTQCYKQGRDLRPDDCIGGIYNPGISMSPKSANPDTQTAIDYAAFKVLTSVFPAVDFSTFFAQAEPAAPATDAEKAGRSIGEQAATVMIATRTGDGSTDTTAYVPSTAPGQWRPTGSGDAATPNWGKVRRFSRFGSPQPPPDFSYPVDYRANGTLDRSPVSSSSARPQLPGGFSNITTMLASQAYADQVNEVKELGRVDSTTRTAEQTQIAWFWANDLNGTYKPPGQLLDMTRDVSVQRGLGELQNAKLFGSVSLALADAGIASWDSKYQTPIDLWRPETAIRLAADDGNANTVADPSWQPLSADTAGVHFSPAFPAYVSGHATFGGAWAASMKAYFGTDSISFTAETEDPHAVDAAGNFLTRSFTSFSQAGIEDARSRIYLGVHYSWDGDYGYATGQKLVGNGGELLADGTRTHTTLGVTTGYTYPAPSSTAAPYYTYSPDLSRDDSIRDAFNQCDYDGADMVQGQRLGNSWACNVQYDGKIFLYIF
ncbi:hypothetical protein GCM10023194_67370 [Planotetraspora phitsanulokensis]|uniref:vanadium-dependent haloperoxidase n=1 Tax=Planotetraspora phitsanulokensis TaxID=575192 RepID=UPI00194E56D6|nr:vanadium-dependent haloperoxidase [Planotetraspora phitsanulokensis]